MRKRKSFHPYRFVLAALGLSLLAFVVSNGINTNAEPEATSEPFEAAETAQNKASPAPANDEYVYTMLARYPVPLDDDLQYHIYTLCADYQISPGIVYAMIEQESDYNADLVGDNGESFGLMQIQPQWHKERMDKLGVTDLFDPFQNVTVGIDYLAECLDYDKGIEFALMAYNGGVNYAYMKDNAGVITDYAREVIANSEILTEGVLAVMYRTDDPIADFDRWDAEQARKEAMLPCCDYCGDPVTDDFYVHCEEVICQDCLDSHFRRSVEDYME